MPILNQVRAIIAEQHGMRVNEITPDTDLYQDLDDSLDAVSIYMICEEAFDLSFPDKDIEEWNLTTARTIAAYIEFRLAQHGAV